MSVTFLTDGRAEAVALARWAMQRGVDARLLESRGQRDLEHIAARRKELPAWGVIVVLGSSSVSTGEVDTRDAYAVASDWLSSYSPIDRRSLGAALLDEGVRSQRPGTESLIAFLSAVGLPQAAVGRVRVNRGGRPRTGKDPFRGTGFDVCVALLSAPGRTWTERALAGAAGRANSATHGVSVELVRRGLLQKTPAGWVVERPDVLLGAFAEAWRTRTGSPRESAAFAWNGRGDALDAFRRGARRQDVTWLLGGPSAAGALLVGGPRVVYVAQDIGAALESERFVHTSPMRADLLVWSPLEAGVFRAPRKIEGGYATNLVVTCVDLLASGSERERQVAMELWKGIRE